MATLVDLPMVGPYTVTEDPDNPGTPNGPTPDDLLADGSLSTWIDVGTYIGGSGVFLNHVDAQLDAAPVGTDPITSNPMIRVYARFDGSPIVGVQLSTSGAGSSSQLEPGVDPIESPLGTLYLMDSNGLGQVNNAINGFTVLMQVQVPAQRDDPAAVARIYEAGIVVRLLGNEAPSCRNFPADTSNSPGGGVRQFPPSKAWARSNRFGGGYG